MERSPLCAKTHKKKNKRRGEILFIDSGYACYEEEMLDIFRREIPDFDNAKKTILITHADVDHCGLLPIFDEILASYKSAECLHLEYNGEDGFREQNLLHKPYVNICKTLTSYCPPCPDKLRVTWGDGEMMTAPFMQIGFFDLAHTSIKKTIR